MQNKCKYINPETNEECQAFALESGYCFSHDPDKREEKQLAVTKGGLASKKERLNLPPVVIKDPADVITVLEETINMIRTGNLSCTNPANAIGFLCSHILKAMEMTSVSEKLDVIERVITAQRIRKGKR